MSKAGRKKALLDNMLKKDIVDTVMKLVHGQEAVTMEEVAKECGVAKGTLYNYFKNRDDLLNHVHNSVITPILESNRDIFNGSHPPKESLMMFIDSVYRVHEEVCVYFRFMYNIRTVEDEYRDRFHMVIDPLAKLLKDGIDKGIFIDVDPYILADMVFGTVIGPLKSMFYRNMTCMDTGKMKQDTIKLINMIVIK